jgi:FAD/FMN-containing dehydrogenase
MLFSSTAPFHVALYLFAHAVASTLDHKLLIRQTGGAIRQQPLTCTTTLQAALRCFAAEEGLPHMTQHDKLCSYVAMAYLAELGEASRMPAAAAADKPVGFAAQLAGLCAALLKGVSRTADSVWCGTPAGAQAAAAVQDAGSTTALFWTRSMVKLSAVMSVTQMVQHVAEMVAAEQKAKGQAVAGQWLFLPAKAGEGRLLTTCPVSL